jgi:hypothetical protein
MAVHVRDNRGGNWFWIHNVIVDAYGKTLGPYGLAVYMVLCRHAGQEQATWIGQKNIAEYLVSYPSLAAAEAALPGYYLHRAC